MKQKKSKESVFTKLSYVFIVLMLTVFLFWFNSSGYGGITEAKLTVFNIICGGYVILMLILIPASLATEVISKQELKAYIRESTWVQRLLLIFLLLTVVSALISPYRSETWVGASRYEGVRTIAIYVLTAVFMSSFVKVKPWMAYLLGASVLCFSVISIIQLYGGNPFGLYPGDLSYFGAGVDYSGAYLGTIGNTDLVAGFLCVAITLLWVAVVRMKGKWRFALLIPPAAALFVLLKMSWQVSSAYSAERCSHCQSSCPYRQKRERSLRSRYLSFSFSHLYFSTLPISAAGCCTRRTSFCTAMSATPSARAEYTFGNASLRKYPIIFGSAQDRTP